MAPEVQVMDRGRGAQYLCAQNRTEELVYQGIENYSEQLKELAHFIKVILDISH